MFSSKLMQTSNFFVIVIAIDYKLDIKNAIYSQNSFEKVLILYMNSLEKNI